MSKKATRALLWNVHAGRIESLHEDKKGAEEAAERFKDKSGVNQDGLQLEAVEFSITLPEPDPPSEETKAAEKKAHAEDKAADKKEARFG
jgi:hypothetical protein